MKVSEIMTRSAHTILPDATVEQASRKMRDDNIGLLTVCEAGKIFGVVTDRDIVVRSIASGLTPHLTTVREIMTRKPLCCYDDQSITEATKMMEKNQLRRLIVINRENQLVGVLTVTDLALKSTNEKLSGQVLHKVTGKGTRMGERQQT
jgi:CBS domain-containing protein